jgi:aminocarboxymuconate-semialdehyde decarboxylase
MTRRDFVEETAVGGIAFVGVRSAGRSGRGAGADAAREVVVNGKRVKTVDIHAHCAVPEAMALMNLKVTASRICPTCS